MASDTDARYLRQILLAEIGSAGQARIARAAARVGGDGLAHEIASRYAERAGFARVESGRVDVDVLAPESVSRDPSSRAVLAGSRAALKALLDAVLERA